VLVSGFLSELAPTVVARHAVVGGGRHNQGFSVGSLHPSRGFHRNSELFGLSLPLVGGLLLGGVSHMGLGFSVYSVRCGVVNLSFLLKDRLANFSMLLESLGAELATTTVARRQISWLIVIFSGNLAVGKSLGAQAVKIVALRWCFGGIVRVIIRRLNSGVDRLLWFLFTESSDERLIRN